MNLSQRIYIQEKQSERCKEELSEADYKDSMGNDVKQWKTKKPKKDSSGK